MAEFNVRNYEVQITDTAAADKDVSGQIETIGLEESIGAGTHYTFGSRFQQAIANGTIAWSGSLTGIATDGAAEALEVIKAHIIAGSVIPIVFGQPDLDTVGSTTFTFNAVPQGSLKIVDGNAGNSDVQKFTLNFHVDGDVTEATVS